MKAINVILHIISTLALDEGGNKPIRARGLWARQMYARDHESPLTSLNSVSDSLQLCDVSQQAFVRLLSTRLWVRAVFGVSGVYCGFCWQIGADEVAEHHNGGPATLNKVRTCCKCHMLKKHSMVEPVSYKIILTQANASFLYSQYNRPRYYWNNKSYK